MGPVEQVVLGHYAAGLRALSDAELAEQAAEVACLPGALADVMRALVDAERAGRTEQPAPQPQPRPGQPVPGGTPWPDPVQVPRRGPRYLDQDDPMGVLHTRDDDEPVTPIELPADAGWHVGGPVGRTVDLILVPTKACGCLVGDLCRCACNDTRDRIELHAVSLPPEQPFDLRWLREHHVTAADLDRQWRAA